MTPHIERKKPKIIQNENEEDIAVEDKKIQLESQAFSSWPNHHCYIRGLLFIACMSWHSYEIIVSTSYKRKRQMIDNV